MADKFDPGRGILLVNRAARQKGANGLALPLSRWMGIHNHHISNADVSSGSISLDNEVVHVEKAVQRGVLDTLWVPVFRDNNHFSLYKVDFRHRELFYGDSLHLNKPISEHCMLLAMYAERMLPGPPLRLSSHRLPVPLQQDGLSCGDIVLSTIATEVIGSPNGVT